MRISNVTKHELSVKLNSHFGNILLHPHEIFPIKMAVHFLIRKEITDVHGKINFVQINETDNKILGGEQFDIQRYTRTPFVANAGGDKEVTYLDSLFLSAQDIFEDAIFNWYDEEGILLHSGREFKMMALNNQKFKLEIVSLKDGAKDYDSLQVSIKAPSINYITPNPASDHVTMGLNLPSEHLFTLVFTNIQTGQVRIIPVENNGLQLHNINLDSFDSGYCAVSLCSQSDLFDTKIFLIQKN